MGGLIVDIDVDADARWRGAEGGRGVQWARRRSAVIFRTPYDKARSPTSKRYAQDFGAQAAAVVQDTRGRFRSGGPVADRLGAGRQRRFRHEWTAPGLVFRPRGNGWSIHLGIAQLFAAALQPPLAAIAPHMASAWPPCQETGGALDSILYSWLAFMAPDWLSKRAWKETLLVQNLRRC